MTATTGTEEVVMMENNDDDDNDNDHHPQQPVVDNDVEKHPMYWRYHFPRDRFADLWFHMNQLGWTYNASRGHYQAPSHDGSPGRIFESAEAVRQYINSFALSRVYTNLQWANDYDADPQQQRHKEGQNQDAQQHTDEMNDEAQRQREIGLALRKAILQRSHEKGERVLDNEEESSLLDNKEASLDDDDNNDDNTDATTNKSLHGGRRSSRVAARSVTAVEKGADLYLRRRTKNPVKQNQHRRASSSSKPTGTEQRLSVKECQDFLEAYPMDEIEKIEATYYAQFPKWRFLLSTNHSLLFYGAGSKTELLNAFANQELFKEGESLIIDGTDEEVTIDGLLDLLVRVYLDNDEPTDLPAVHLEPDNVPRIGKFCPWKADAPVERAIQIGRGLAHQTQEASEPQCPIFLVIHSLDARLATPAAQKALAALVTNSTVANGVACLRLVASVDHVDAPTFLWDAVTEANFSWFPCCVHTHRPFIRELSPLIDEDGAARKKTERANRTNTQAQRILDVLRNLAPRHTEVVQLLAQLQVNQDEWVDYLQYRDRCKSACAINKDSQLRHLLTELKDHGLIVSKTEGSNEFVQIPFSAEKLQEIIDFARDA